MKTDTIQSLFLKTNKLTFTPYSLPPILEIDHFELKLPHPPSQKQVKNHCPYKTHTHIKGVDSRILELTHCISYITIIVHIYINTKQEKNNQTFDMTYIYFLIWFWTHTHLLLLLLLTTTFFRYRVRTRASKNPIY